MCVAYIAAGRKLRLEIHAMRLIDALAEKKIQEGIERGDLERLGGGSDAGLR